jgi:hypothetical protein
MGPGAGLDDKEMRKILPLPGLELRPHGHPARSQSLSPLPVNVYFKKSTKILQGFFYKGSYQIEHANK